MVEEIQHERFVDVFNPEFLDVLFQRVGRVAQQQLNGVAISQNGIDCKAFLDRQVVAKEAFYEVGKYVMSLCSSMGFEPDAGSGYESAGRLARSAPAVACR